MTNERINEIAKQAIIWAQGSWGQSEYDQPRYDASTMASIYHQISEIAASKANHFANEANRIASETK